MKMNTVNLGIVLLILIMQDAVKEISVVLMVHVKKNAMISLLATMMAHVTKAKTALVQTVMANKIVASQT